MAINVASTINVASRGAVVKVGVRELRDNLSRYLDRVHTSGEEIVVTEHGRAVAKVVPIDPSPRQSSLDRLIAEGLASAPVRAKRSLPTRRIEASGSVSELVAEQRR